MQEESVEMKRIANERLRNASDKGQLPEIRKALFLGADINLRVTAVGSSPLMCAAYDGDLEIVKYLLQNKAKVNFQNIEKNTALLFAADHGYLEVSKILLEAKSNPNMRDNEDYDATMLVCRRRHVDILRILLENKASTAGKTGLGDTPLIMAAWNGHVDIALCLIKHNACVNTANNRGDAPLFFAAKSGNTKLYNMGFPRRSCGGHTKAVKKLLELEADIDIQNGHGRSALSQAVQQGHLPAVKCLLENKASVNVQDHRNYSPLLIAVSNGREKHLKLLIDSHADVRCIDKDGFSSLHVAVYRSRLDLIRILVETGHADVTCRVGGSDKGRTPLECAKEVNFNGGIRWYLESCQKKILDAVMKRDIPFWLSMLRGEIINSALGISESRIINVEKEEDI
ncbi:hypothetical protein AAMO2058_000832400 [Amorphochlora amoebiformis]